MPSPEVLKKSALKSMAGQKRNLYRIVANNSPEMESRLSVTELKKKKMNQKQHSPTKDYVQNFSKAADANLVYMMSKVLQLCGVTRIYPSMLGVLFVVLIFLLFYGFHIVFSLFGI